MLDSVRRFLGLVLIPFKSGQSSENQHKAVLTVSTRLNPF